MEPNQKKPIRGIFILPSLLTTGALFFGFYSIIKAINGQFEAACIAIFIAMVLDGLDGRVARLTNTQSEFGAEYDSLSDNVSFGLAPSLLAYLWILQDLGRAGWLAAFIFSACAALRLARFNVQISVIDKAYFQGLASPAAAAVIASFVWVCSDYGIETNRTTGIALFCVTTLSGLLMVSNVRYHSFKEINVKNKIPFIVAVVIMLTFAVLLIQPALILFILSAGYLLSGPILTVAGIHQRRKNRRAGVD